MAPSPVSIEKDLPADSSVPVDVVDEEDNAITGYVLDPKAYPNHAAGLYLTSDGSKVLIPQPTADPNDPLVWPTWRKNLVLLVVCICAFPPDYSSAMASVTMIVQSKYVELFCARLLYILSLTLRTLSLTISSTLDNGMFPRAKESC